MINKTDPSHNPVLLTFSSLLARWCQKLQAWQREPGTANQMAEAKVNWPPNSIFSDILANLPDSCPFPNFYSPKFRAKLFHKTTSVCPTNRNRKRQQVWHPPSKLL